MRDRVRTWSALAVAVSALLWCAPPALATPQLVHVTGTVAAIAPDGSGGYYLGGHFSAVGGVPINDVAHILANGTVDRTWNPNPSGCGYDQVYALAVSGSTVYIGGGFCTITDSAGTGTVSRTGAAAVSASTGRANAWNPSPTGAIHALAVSGSTVYLGGQFTSVTDGAGTGAVTRNNAAAVSAATGFDTGWNPDPNGYVAALAVSGSTVYIGGRFSAITDSAGTATVARYNAAAVSTSTGRDTGWSPDPAFGTAHPGSGYVAALAVAGSTVYVGGGFTTIAGAAGTRTTRNDLAAVSASTGRAGAWNPNPSGAVISLALSGSSVYFGGRFGTITSSTGAKIERDFAAAVSAGTGRDTGWIPSPTPGAPAAALAVSGSSVYLGGQSYASTASTALPKVTLSHIKTRPGGTINFELRVSGPGALNVLETASPGHVAFAHKHLSARHAGTIKVTVGPRSKHLLRPKRKLKLSLTIRYTPSGGQPVTISRAGIRITT